MSLGKVIKLFIFLVLITNVFSKFTRPTIYPQKKEIVVDSGFNLTLGCVASEPSKWTFFDGENKMRDSYFINDRIVNNTKSKYRFESILTVVNVSYLDIGFYSCHGISVNLITPLRSNNIFVYVRYKNRLSFYPNSMITESAPRNAIVPIPCRPTAPDVNVTLIYRDLYDHLHVINVYSNEKINKFPENDVIENFNPAYGFAIRQLYSWTQFYCIFQRDNIKEHTAFRIKITKVEDFKTFIEGPDLLITQIGESLILNCTVIANRNIKLKWSFPNITDIYKINILNLQPVKLVRFTKLLISRLTINNITTEFEGNYKCFYEQNDSNEKYEIGTTKYVAVIDKTVNNPPEITYPLGEEVQIKAEENLTLVCESSNSITWKYPTKFAEESLDLFFILRTEAKKLNIEIKNETYAKNNKTFLYRSKLIIKKAHHLNTGFYSCHETNTINNNPFKSKTIYLYVKDDNNLRATISNIPLIMFYNRNDNVTIPCLPSSPEVKVSLKIENYTFAVSYTYDPHYGFNIFMTFNTSLNIYCTFELEGHKTETSKYILDYSDFFTYETSTFLETPKNNIVYQNEELNLYCKIVLSKHNLQIPEWIIPNKNRTNSEISVSTIPIDGGNVLTSKLTIKNVQQEDEGFYVCFVANITDKINKVNNKTFISVIDGFDVKPFIYGLTNNRTYYGANMTLYCNTTLDHNSVFDVNWNVPNTTYKKADNYLVTKLEQIVTVRGLVGKSTLELKNISSENRGNYTCTAKDSRNNKKRSVVDVKVENPSAPKIIYSNMNESKIKMKIGESINWTCLVDGLPYPSISWTKDEVTFLENNNSLLISFLKPKDSGIYSCIACVYLKCVSRKTELIVEEPSTDTILKKEPLIFLSSITVLLILAIVITIMIRRRNELAFRRKLIEGGILNFETGEIQNIDPKINIIEQAFLLPYNRKWDISRDKIKLGHEIGSGNFGSVLQAEIFGVFQGETIKTVAVKMIKSSASLLQLNAFISELKIMTHIGKHINIINLLGACTENISNLELLIVVEYCKYGNVQNYLRQNRGNFKDLINKENGLVEFSENNDASTLTQPECNQFTTIDLICWSFQIARGMEYLVSRKILHGDLAARNILLAEDNIVKISDFGLSKNMRRCSFYKKKNNKCPMPIKWMSIEAIRDGIFSTQSDVWSFGILLWEFFSLGIVPYPDMETNFKFFYKISQGYRMELPQYSTKEIYEIMLKCWKVKPSDRPSFTDLVTNLGSLLQDNIKEHYLELQESSENQNEEEEYFSSIASPEYSNIISNLTITDNSSSTD